MNRLRILIGVLALSAGCHHLDTTQMVESYQTFGEAVYRELCQRVAYVSQLELKAAGQRETVDVDGSLGKLVCVRNMMPPPDASPRLVAMHQHRDKLISAIDTTVPDEMRTPLQNFLESILPLTDDGTLGNVIDDTIKLLDEMRQDETLTSAMARLGAQKGAIPPGTAEGLLRAMFSYPDAHATIGKLTRLVAKDGDAYPELTAVLDAASRELKDLEPPANPNDPERTARLARNLLFSPHPLFPLGLDYDLVLRDDRGIPRVNLAAGAGFVDKNMDGLADVDALNRFVDANGVALNPPTPFPVPGKADPGAAGRDSKKRATGTGGALLYEYKNLDDSALASLGRQNHSLLNVEKDTLFGLLWGAGALLGKRAQTVKEYSAAAGGPLSYSGFDTKDAALLDLVHAFTQLLGMPDAEKVLQATVTLMRDHEGPISRQVGAMFDAKERGKRYPNAVIPEKSTLYDELAVLIVRTLRVPGLAEDLIKALQNPHAKGFSPMLARLNRAKNQIDFDPNIKSTFPLVNNLDVEEPIDRSQPDVDYNRSLIQRIGHLIHDADETPFCNREGAMVPTAPGMPFAKCALFKVDDLAMLFILNMATPSIVDDPARAATTRNKANFCEQMVDPGTRGLLTGPGGGNLLQTLVGIEGFTCFPTPKAQARSLFLRVEEQTQFQKDTTELIQCKDGDLFVDVHDKSLFAWETTLKNNPSGFENDTFYDAVRPIIDAFAKHDECLEYDSNNVCIKAQNAAKIFTEIFAMLHEHWGSPQSSYFGHTYQSTDRNAPRFGFPDNIVSYETLINEVLTQGALLQSIEDVSPILDTFTVDGTLGGERALPYVINAVRYAFDPQITPANVAYRDGRTSTVMSDGVTPVNRATVYYLLADAYAARRAQLAATDPARRDAWNRATSSLLDDIFTTETTDQGSRFKNRQTHGFSQVLVSFLRDRVAAHRAAGDLTQWVGTTLSTDISDVIAGPVVAGLSDLVVKLEAHPDTRDALYRMLAYTMDDQTNPAAFRANMITVGDLVQLGVDDKDLLPIAHLAGKALEGSRKLVEHALILVRGTNSVDNAGVFDKILANLFIEDTNGETPSGKIGDALTEINRVVPASNITLDAADHRSVLSAVHDFLFDEQRGFRHFLAIVKERNPR